MARLKIYTDENLDGRVAEGLRRVGVDATTVYNEGKTGLNDQAQLGYGSSLRAVVFTHDPDFIEVAQEMNRREEDHCGLIFVEMHRLGLGECIRRLALYAEVVTAEEMMNRIEFL